jgi:putative PIN family toxin of toxin-antitoxin system
VRIVIDTNVLISGLLRPETPPHQLLALWRARRFTLLCCDEQLDEITRVTRYEKLRARLDTALVGRLVNELRTVAARVERLVITEVTRDPYDDYLLAMAAAGGADILITGDKRDVLHLGHHGRCRIMTAKQAIDILGT